MRESCPNSRDFIPQKSIIAEGDVVLIIIIYVNVVTHSCVHALNQALMPFKIFCIPAAPKIY